MDLKNKIWGLFTPSECSLLLHISIGYGRTTANHRSMESKKEVGSGQDRHCSALGLFTRKLVLGYRTPRYTEGLFHLFWATFTWHRDGFCVSQGKGVLRSSVNSKA